MPLPDRSASRRFSLLSSYIKHKKRLRKSAKQLFVASGAGYSFQTPSRIDTDQSAGSES